MARRSGENYLWSHVDVCERTAKCRRHQRRVYKVASWGQDNCSETCDCRACAATRRRCQPPGHHYLFDQNWKSCVDVNVMMSGLVPFLLCPLLQGPYGESLRPEANFVCRTPSMWRTGIYTSISSKHAGCQAIRWRVAPHLPALRVSSRPGPTAVVCVRS